MQKKTLNIILTVIAVLVILFFLLKPQLRILAGYVAKNVCSCTFVAERDFEQVKAEDVAYGLLSLSSVEIDRSNKMATASVLNLVERTAIYRGDLGCVLKTKNDPINKTNAQIQFPNGSDSFNMKLPLHPIKQSDFLVAEDYERVEKAISMAFEAAGTRAVIVIKNDTILGENYASGFDRHSLHLGWSMSKSITNALIGILVRKGKLNLEQASLIEEWEIDDRKEITLSNLLQMNSGLAWEEAYGKVSNATNMLFEEDAMGMYALQQKKSTSPNQVWYYSSGTSNILSEIIRQQFSSEEAYWNFPYQSLFAKINAASFRLEADESGTFVGSSYGFANARDWAKLGLLYLNDGVWNGAQILPENWVDYTKSVAPNSEGEYGAQFWLNQGSKFPDAPTDLYYCGGFDGQYVFIIPSQNMVAVRLGVDGLGEMNPNDFLKILLGEIEEK